MKFINENSDANKSAEDTVSFIAATPRYIRITCYLILYSVEFIYPITSCEFRRFSKSKNLNKRNRFIRFWATRTTYIGDTLFKIIFAICGLVVHSQGGISEALNYKESLDKKLGIG